MRHHAGLSGSISFISLCLCIVTICLATQTTFAGLNGTLYFVDSLEDSVKADGYLTLREAIAAASGNVRVNEAPAGSATETDVIIFEPDLISSGGHIYITDTLNIKGDTYIEASLYNPITLHGTNNKRIMNIEDSHARVDIIGLKFTAVDENLKEAIYSTARLSTDGCIFTNNKNAIHNNGGELYVYGSDFYRNKRILQTTDCDNGGAIFSEYGKLTVESCYFEGNQVTDGYGGAIFISKQDALIVDSQFTDNSANYALFNGFGGAISISHSTLTIYGCEFTGNHADNSGTIHMGQYCLLNVTHSVFSGNSGSVLGAPQTARSEININNSLIVGNYHDKNYPVLDGNAGTSTFTNCTIAGNSSEKSGLMFTSGDLVLTNTIISENYFGVSDEIAPEYQLQNFYDSVYKNLVTDNCIIDSDAGFIRNPSAGPDGIWFTDDDDLGNLRLRPGSNAVDAGDNDLVPDDTAYSYGDLDGNERQKWQAVDIGAYELQDAPPSNRETPSTHVTTPVDCVNYFDSNISLREAILYADQLKEPVTFDRALNRQRLVATLGAIQINDDIDIQCNIDFTIDANGNEHAIEAQDNASMQISGLKFTSAAGSAIRFSGKKLKVSNCEFFNNGSTDSGGAIDFSSKQYIEPRELVIYGSRLVGNIAYLGGAVYCEGYNAHIYIINSVISGNRAKEDAGGVYVKCYQPNGSTLKIVNSTITHNLAIDNGDPQNIGGVLSHNFETKLYNSIIAMNWNIQDYNDLGIFADLEILNCLIDTDPMFVAYPDAGDDGYWASSDDNYGDLHLSPGSPAVDAGDNSLARDEKTYRLTADIAGINRFDNEITDIGAYELLTGLQADIDGDGDVDMIDFLEMRSHYGRSSQVTFEMGDVDRDGDVDIFDFLILRSEYGQKR